MSATAIANRVSHNGTAEYANQAASSVIPAVSTVTYLQLSNLQLSGSIPQSLNTASLAYIILNGNKLTGAIPDLSQCVNLRILQLNDNNLTTLTNPSMFTTMTSLATLNLANNYLTGPCPDLPASLTSLRLDCSGLTGDLPPSITSCLSLQTCWTGTLTGPNVTAAKSKPLLTTISRSKFNESSTATPAPAPAPASVKSRTKGALLAGFRSGALEKAVDKMDADAAAATPAAPAPAPASVKSRTKGALLAGFRSGALEKAVDKMDADAAAKVETPPTPSPVAAAPVPAPPPAPTPVPAASSPTPARPLSTSAKKLKLNLRLASAKNLPSVRAFWGTKVSRYATVTFAGETLRTDPAEGQKPVWGSVHALEFGAKSVDKFAGEDVVIEIYETKNDTLQASVTFAADSVPQGGKMVATLHKELDLEPEGSVQIEAWCGRM